MLGTVPAAAMLHGVFTVGLPIAILRWTGASPLLPTGVGASRWPGAALIGFGAYLCVSAGRLLRRGTSAIPGAKPAVLVTDGWYARTRNPCFSAS